ncbi:MAG: phosphate signaling complex protein PhoU [Brevinemataceae bacterium]
MIEQKVCETKKAVYNYINLIDTMLGNTINCALEDNWEGIREVTDVLEPQANAMELEIAQGCLAILALYHPEAGNLRSIVKMSGMASDLERMGDMITKIAFATYYWRNSIHLKNYPNLIEMVSETRKMIEKAKHAFMDEDSLLAISVIQYDDIVDDLCTMILKQLIKEMNAAEEVEPLLQMINVARNIERIADLCAHLAEGIIFIKEGLVPNKKDKSKK